MLEHWSVGGEELECWSVGALAEKNWKVRALERFWRVRALVESVGAFLERDDRANLTTPKEPTYLVTRQ
jgi:hypothetical protein